MAQQKQQKKPPISGLMNGYKLLKNIPGIADKLPSLLGGSAAPATSYTTGALPGTMMADKITAAGASGGGSLLSSLAPAMPFAGLASFVLPQIIEGFGPQPRIGFSGTDPKYQMDIAQNLGPGQYLEYNGAKPKYKSSKYDYAIDVRDTGDDDNIASQMIKAYDTMFDNLADQGVPVNDLLATNKNFYAGGRLETGMTPESLISGTMQHLTPDINAYLSGNTPAAKTITVQPMSTDPSSGRDNYDMARTKQPYQVTIDAGGEPGTPSKSSDEGGNTQLQTGQGVNQGFITNQAPATSQTGQGGSNMDQDLWAQALNMFVDEGGNLIQEDADFKKGEAEQFGQTVTGAADKDTALANSLLGQLQTNSGMFANLPTAGGGHIQPGSNSRRAQSMLNLSGRGRDNTVAAAGANYGTVDARSPVKGRLDYLQALLGTGAQDKTFGQEDDKIRNQAAATSAQIGAANARAGADAERARITRELGLLDYNYKNRSLDLEDEWRKAGFTQNQNQFNAQQEANEPGFFDYLPGIVGAGLGIAKIGEIGGLWGGGEEDDPWYTKLFKGQS